jgi:hypothetical protein
VREQPGGAKIDPQLMSPLRPPRTSNADTPSKPCLSATKLHGTPSGDAPCSRSPLKARRSSNVAFSPFNMVKIIPSKEHSENYGQVRARHRIASHRVATHI